MMPLALVPIVFMLVMCDGMKDLPFVGVCATQDTGKRMCGTGFAVEDGSYIFTARHVAMNEDTTPKYDIQIHTREHFGEDISAEVIYNSPKYDFSVLKISHKIKNTLNICAFEPEIGDKVTNYGYFDYGNIYKFDGEIGAFWGIIIESSSKSIDGFSGGPMINNEYGCVEGLVYGHIKSNGHALATPGTRLLYEWHTRPMINE